MDLCSTSSQVKFYTLSILILSPLRVAILGNICNYSVVQIAPISPTFTVNIKILGSFTYNKTKVSSTFLRS